jgi:Ni,Fe-hydrogenase III small subunit
VRAVRAELAARTRRFRRSLHIRHVDAGSDGSEEWEIAALTDPVHDIHRLGMFFTAGPRHADVLLVTGAGARGMAAPLRRTYEATAQPVVVVAVGTDACGGGVFADSYATHGGLAPLVDVDVWVPGSPPSPFSLLHALAVAGAAAAVPGGRRGAAVGRLARLRPARTAGRCRRPSRRGWSATPPR